MRVNWNDEPDPHATPEQVAALDRVLAFFDGNPDGPYTAEDVLRMRELNSDLHKATPGLYGCEWAHRNWFIGTHGSHLYVEPMTPEFLAASEANYAAFQAAIERSRAKPRLQGRRLPEAPHSALR